MKEIVWHCDLCLSKGQEVIADHVATAVVIGKAKERLIDLCDADYKLLVTPLVDALAEHGYNDTPPKPKRDEGPFTCLVSECEAAAKGRVWKNRRSFNGHVLEVHGIGMDDYREKYGNPVPVAADAA